MKTLNNVDIRQVRGHWECTVDGEFVCSGDTLDEIITELAAVYGTEDANVS